MKEYSVHVLPSTVLYVNLIRYKDNLEDNAKSCAFDANNHGIDETLIFK